MVAPQAAELRENAGQMFSVSDIAPPNETKLGIHTQGLPVAENNTVERVINCGTSLGSMEGFEVPKQPAQKVSMVAEAVGSLINFAADTSPELVEIKPPVVAPAPMLQTNSPAPGFGSGPS